MFERKLYEALENHISKKQVTVITGLRRVGKSTALKFLLNKVATSNKLYFDLERIVSEAKLIIQKSEVCWASTDKK